MSTLNRRMAKLGLKILNVLVILSLTISGAGSAAVKVAEEKRAPSPVQPASNPPVSHPAPVFARPQPRVGTRPEQANDQAVKIAPTNLPKALPAIFVQNVGQFNSKALFEMQGGQDTIFLASDTLWISRVEKDLASSSQSTNIKGLNINTIPGLNPVPGLNPPTDAALKGVNLRLSFADANPAPAVVGFDPAGSHISYMMGKNPADRHANVPGWGGVRYENFYPGYDLVLTGGPGEWSWQFARNSKAAPNQPGTQAWESANIRLQIDGANSLSLGEGMVKIATGVGEVDLPLPGLAGDEAAQGNTARPVGQARIDGNQVVLPVVLPVWKTTGAALPAGDSRQVMADTTGVEPASISYQAAASLAHQNQRGGHDQALEKVSIDKNIPVNTLGDASQALSDSNPIFYNTANIVYYTFLPFSAVDMAIDLSGCVYLTGWTSTSQFPTTPGAFDTNGDNEDSDGFITKLSSDGSTLVYSTFLNGVTFGISIDTSGNAYVTGATSSPDFPVTPGAYDTSWGGMDPSKGTLAFITKLNADGTGLIYSTFIGGTITDGSNYALNNGTIIALDPDNNAYVMGRTKSSNFPTTPGAYDNSFAPNDEYNGFFILKLNPSGSGLVYSTYFPNADCSDIVVDTAGHVYITGGSNTEDFPITPGAYKNANGSGNFVTELNTTGSGLVYSAILVSTNYPGVDSIALDSSGDAYITGGTSSPDFPVTPNAFDTQFQGGDIWVSELNPTGSTLLYSTFLGGGYSGGYTDSGIAVDASGDAYVVGSTLSNTFPVTFQTSQNTKNNAYLSDGFVVKLSSDGEKQVYSTTFGSNQTDDVAYSVGIDAAGNAYVYGIDGLSTGYIQYVVKFKPVPVVSEDAALNCGCGGDGSESSQAQTQVPVHHTINTRTGDLYYQNTDISIPTTAGPLSFERTYSSLATALYTTTLGYGWTDNLDTRLIFPTDPGGEAGYVLFKDHSANQYQFIINDDGSYSPDAGVKGSLTCTGSSCNLVLPSQEQYTFSNGKLQTWQDGQGNAWNYTYDPSGDLTRVANDSGDRYLSLTYDQGQIASVSDYSGRSVSFSYDPGTGDLITATDVLGGTWQYQYDSAHHLTQVIDPGGATTERTEYDSQGRAVRQYDGNGQEVLVLTYNAADTTSAQDAFGNVTTYAYDGRKTNVGESDPLTAASSKTYDNNFQPLTITDPGQHTTSLAWSADGADLTNITDAAGGQTAVTYDSLHNPSSVTDPLNNLTSFNYSGTLLMSTVDALNNTTSYTYTPQGQIQTITDPQGIVTRYEYDPDGERTETIVNYDPSHQTDEQNVYNLTTTYTYDALGRVITVTDPSGQVTKTDYDNAGRVVQTTQNYDPIHTQQNYPTGSGWNNIVTTYAYDLHGNQIAVTDTFGVITRTYYDLDNRVVTTVQNLSGQSIETPTPPARGSGAIDQNVRTDTVYDAAGNAIATINPLGVITRTYFDAANRPVTTVQNLTGQDISVTTPPVFNPLYPDQNVRTDTVYDASGLAIASIDT
ncbi:MAG: DUF6531 domain-containing protein, partial [Anaerolineales bacterium]